RTPYVSERLPSLPFPQPTLAYSSGTSSPRVSSIASSTSSNGESHSSFTSAASVYGFVRASFSPNWKIRPVFCN
ncbi:KilA-N domain-containing protein, partial [Apiospora phragmitis]